MATTSLLLQNFDKGLRAQVLSEQLATVSSVGKLFDDHPVPVFVNSILVRLAEAFKDGSNALRVAIARVLGQCGPQLTLAFSSGEIFRRILTVSHANDPEARESTLEILSSLALISPDSKQAHHLISESLTTKHDGEFRAACVALASFSRLSPEFAESMITRVGNLLNDPTISVKRKINLAKVLASQSANARTMEEVFAISRSMVDSMPGDDLLAAFLEATTSLSIETRYAIPQQLNVLLTVLQRRYSAKNLSAKEKTSTNSPSDAEKQETLASEGRTYSDYSVVIVLQQLRRLANLASLWNDEQISRLSRLQPPSLSSSDRRLLRVYLDVVISLSINCANNQLDLINQLLLRSTSLGTLEDAHLRIRYIELATNVTCSRNGAGTSKVETVENEKSEAPLTSLALIISGAMEEKLPLPLAKRLYKSVGEFLLAQSRVGAVKTEATTMVIDALLSPFLDNADVLPNNAPQRLELLCSLADRDINYVAMLHQWAFQVLQANPAAFQAIPQLFAYLALGIGTEMPSTSKSPILFDSVVDRYGMARSALRNGHWRQVALPNLKSIDTRNMGTFESNWIEALKELAASQITESSFSALNVQIAHLQRALDILTIMCSNGGFSGHRDDAFRSPRDLVACFLATSEVFLQIVATIQPFSTVLNAALRPSAYFNPITARRIKFALRLLEPKVNQVLFLWSNLCHSSFGADACSLDLLNLYYSRISVLLKAIRVFVGRPEASSAVQLQPLNAPRTTTQFYQETLHWAVRNLASLACEEFPNSSTLSAFQSILHQLIVLPNLLPRAFFQQFYTVDFKLSVTPQSENGKLYVPPGQTTPVRVDGALTSTHPTSVVAIIVIADVSFVASHSQNFEMRVKVEPSDRNYFHAQFLIEVRQSCEVKFRIEFIDSRQKQWKSAATSTLVINVREPPNNRTF
ncbi:unnamed protein product [Caenorhabditis auriculariae]|uniref:Integrator complex subunit 7 n=1 Tax=Caenorhabditis auriculariae TaxID=2777116 RepID=A0A8S1HQD3_9PELO|nr:unnamed protein product [Caenorhabditis auriculariae]